MKLTVGIFNTKMVFIKLRLLSFASLWLTIFLIINISGHFTAILEIDSNGYIIYCPCMGRFGNQAEQFLGTLQFSKHLNRTLILPPFIEYIKYKISFIPFSNYIDVEPIREYHRVITMEQFMGALGPLAWKPADRSIACYSARNFPIDDKQKKQTPVDSGCNPFEGSPFKEFWHHIGVHNFPAGSRYYAPLQTDFNSAAEWKEKFNDQNVLAFVGAPSSFPTNSRAIQLQRYVHLSERVATQAAKYREMRGFARVPYLSIHIRHGSDWSRACDLVKGDKNELRQLFSSQQCLGATNDRLIPYELCMPTEQQIVESIERTLTYYDARHVHQPPIEHIHVATDLDNHTLWSAIHRRLTRSSVTLHTPRLTIDAYGRQTRHYDEPHFMTDLHLMAYANSFIGNCISSFSAFASRYRVYNLHLESDTHFFAHDRPFHVKHLSHDEL